MSERITKAFGDLIDAVATEAKIVIIPAVMGAFSEVGKNSVKIYQSLKEAATEKPSPSETVTPAAKEEKSPEPIHPSLVKTAALNSLTQEQKRAVLALKEINKSNSEISLILGIPADVVDLVR